MKYIYSLPEPKNEGLNHHINGRLRDLEKEAGIKPYDIKTKFKANRNDVIIVGTEEQIERAKQLITDLIDKYSITTVVPLPSEKTVNKKLCCLITGKQGKTVKSIEEKTKTDIQITPRGVHITSQEPEHRKHAETEIKKLIDQIQLMRKVSIPSEVMGRVIGTRHSNLKNIERDVGVNIDVIDNCSLYVCGEEKNCKKAILQLKLNASEAVYGTLKKRLGCDSFDYVDATDPNYTFELESVQECPSRYWNQDQDYYKICIVDEENEETDEETENEENENADSCGKIDKEQLKTIIQKVLQKIHQERRDGHEGRIPKADLWCHFGHIYLSNVDEGEKDEQYDLKEFQKQFNCQNDGWKMLFDGAVKDMEIKSLEVALSDDGSNCLSVHPHIRYDFQFLTPSCSKIRVKIFLDQDGKPNMDFSKEDIDIRASGSASSSPLYSLCDHFYTRVKVSIAIPSRGMDVRLTIRTVSQIKPDDEKEKGFEETLKDYLDKIKVKEGEIEWPDDKELPNDFCLSYLRKCERRSYVHPDKDGQSYSVTISEEEERDVLGGEEVKKKTDIHIHSDTWDELLLNGEWEPEQIVRDLPQFLAFLRDIQSNICAPQQE